MDNLKIIKLPLDRWREYKALRLLAIKNAPTAFATSYEEAIVESDENWQTYLKEGNEGKKSYLLFAEIGDKLVGMVGAIKNTNKKQLHTASIIAVFVDPDYRGRGLGKLLIQSILKNLKEDLPIIKVDLDVNTQNKDAIRLYESCGFKVVGTYHKDLFYEGVFYDLHEMELIFEDKLP